MNALLLKDIYPNVCRGLKLIRMLNFDSKATIGSIRVDVAMTSACSYQCCFCSSHSYLKETSVEPIFMSDEMASNLFYSLRKLQTKELLFAGNGEPLLSKSLVNNIKKHGRYFKIEVLSNGSTLGLVDEELFGSLSLLTISLNSGNGESHQVTHGYKGENQFPKIVRNIERILKFPDAHNKVKLNYVVTADNYNEIESFFDMATRWDVSFMMRPVGIDFEELEVKRLSQGLLEGIIGRCSIYTKGKTLSRRLRLSFQLINDAFQVAERNLGKGNNLYPCYLDFIQGFIESNGDVLLCSKGQSKPLGNLNNESLQSIWQNKGSLTTRLRATQMHKTNKPMFSGCYDCTNVQYHSLAFHNVYRRLPLLSKILNKNCNGGKVAI